MGLKLQTRNGTVEKNNKPMLFCVDQIDENLWIGNKYALNSQILKENDIKIVINFSSDQYHIDYNTFFSVMK